MRNSDIPNKGINDVYRIADNDYGFLELSSEFKHSLQAQKGVIQSGTDKASTQAPYLSNHL